MMVQVCHVTGARPNFPKAAPVVQALTARGVSQMLIHTGQHYDGNLSDVFFRDLGLPSPDLDLGVGSGSHAEQTAAIMTGVEGALVRTPVQVVVVYGDVNSTVAAALVAAKLGVAVAHVEAGLRSFDMSMPEEVNRVVTDRLATLHFVTSPEAIGHLAREGAPPGGIHFVGNPMIDTLLRTLDVTTAGIVRRQVDLPEAYAVATLHRPSNVDSLSELVRLSSALHSCADLIPIVISVHPRGRANMRAAGIFDHRGIIALEPLGYVDFLSLVRGSTLVLTDSGGVQEETTVLGIPCLTLRPNTERPATITYGTNRLATVENLVGLVTELLAATRPVKHQIPPLWDGKSGKRIAKVLDCFLSRERVNTAQH